MASDPFHLWSLEGRRYVVLGHVISGFFFFVKLLSTYCVIPSGRYLGMPPRSWGLVQGFDVLDGDAAVRIRARHVCGEVQIKEFIS